MADDHIAVLGLGYVGLTLAVVLAEAGFKVTGVEAREETVRELRAGKPHFHEDGLQDLLQRTLRSNLTIENSLPEARLDAYIIAVGTPLNPQTRQPILDYVIHATQQVAQHRTEQSLVILRSTVPVGTARNTVWPILTKSGKSALLAFCPERTAEGVALRELRELPQIVGGIDEESVARAARIFRRVTRTIIEVSSLEAAELIKLLDNAYRDLHFAFANEVALASERLGLDATEVVKSASLGYPRTNIPVPGFVGGPCLEKDPYMLIGALEQVGYHLQLSQTSRQVNESLPLHIANQIKATLPKLRKKPSQLKIFITGLAFKGEPETDDLRGSGSLALADELRSLGAQLYGHDFVAEPKAIQSQGLTPCDIEEGFRGADVVIVGNNHRSYQKLNITRLLSLTNKPALFFDVWHLFDPKTIQANSDIFYTGLGIG